MISNKSYFLLACFTYRGLFSYAEEASSKKNLVPAFVPIKEAFDQCSNGLIGEYPCSMIDLDAFLPNNQISGSQDKRTNDLWGWTDPSSGKEYAIVGFRDGTAFVDISTPTSPMYLGFLPAHTGTSSMWRDIKTYGDYAYIVADEIGHGMQIFDLKQLSSVFNAPVIFRESAHFEINFQGSMKSKSEINFDRYYDKVAEAGFKVTPRQVSDEGYAHNIAINEDSGYAYIVGSNNCAGGLYMLDLSNPLSPSAAGCFSDWGWISDAQCVTYDGPDSDYTNREVCFISYYVGMGVIDVTNKSNPQWISYSEESDFNIIDQGWLTEDKKYFLAGDRNNGGRLRTYMINVSNLDNIFVANTYTTSIVARHGNNFVKGNYLYQANHRGGFRILDLSRITTGILDEVGFFDTTPSLSGSGQDGVWGVYPFYGSGIVVLSSVNEGIFIVRSSEISMMPSLNPSTVPSGVPQPSLNPSTVPSGVPQPSLNPSAVPSLEPTSSTFPSFNPSIVPSIIPSVKPSFSPSIIPSVQPSSFPTMKPSLPPSVSPSYLPSAKPSLEPSISSMPSIIPSVSPSSEPTKSSLPSVVPSGNPSFSPTSLSSLLPSHMPSVLPSSSPTSEPPLSILISNAITFFNNILSLFNSILDSIDRLLS